MKVSNWKIRDIHSALVALGDRRLPSLETAKKVVTLRRRYFDKPKKIYDDLQAAVIKQNPPPPGWEDRDLPVILLEAREFAFRELLDDEQEIRDIPESLILDDDDLPKRLKGEQDDANQVSIATVIRNLHFLFQSNIDEDAEDAKALAKADAPALAAGGA